MSPDPKAICSSVNRFFGIWALLPSGIVPEISQSVWISFAGQDPSLPLLVAFDPVEVARRVDTQFGEKWLITPASIARHIAYIKEVTPVISRDVSRPAEASRDVTRTGSALVRAEVPADNQHRQAPTSADQSRPAATPPDTDRYVSRLESENEFLRGQVVVKDGQIKELTERARETNLLIGGLQKMLTPLLGSRRGSGGDEHAAGDAFSDRG